MGDEDKKTSPSGGMRPIFKSAGNGDNPTITYIADGITGSASASKKMDVEPAPNEPKPVEEPKVEPVAPPAPKPVDPTKTVEKVHFTSVGQGSNPLITLSKEQIKVSPAPVSAPAPKPAPAPMPKPTPKPVVPRNRVGMQPARKLSAREELNRIAPKAPVAPTPVKKQGGDKKKFIIFGIIAIAIIGIIVAVVLLLTSNKKGGSNGKDFGKGVGTPNYNAIFDETNPIPYEEDGKWGYLNSTGGVAIEAKYEKADRFYGEYASVIYYDDAKMMKNAIIDRNGNIKVDQDPTRTMGDNYYDVENNIWYINSNVYSYDLDQLNAPGTNGHYIGGGLIKNTPNSIVEDENDDDRVVTHNELGNPYITNIKGETVYGCNNSCYVEADDNGRYMVVSETGKNSEIVEIASKNVVYTSDKANSVVYSGDNSFEDYSKNKYIVINNGSAEEKDSLNDGEKNVISGQSDVYYEECGDGLLKINDNGNETDCDIEQITSLPKNVFNKALADGKKLVIIQKNNKGYLYDLKSKTEVLSLPYGSYITTTEDSPFIITSASNGNSYVYNVLNEKYYDFEQLKVSNFNLSGNFIQVIIDNNKKIFNNELSEISK